MLVTYLYPASRTRLEPLSVTGSNITVVLCSISLLHSYLLEHFGINTCLKLAWGRRKWVVFPDSLSTLLVTEAVWRLCFPLPSGGSYFCSASREWQWLLVVLLFRGCAQKLRELTSSALTRHLPPNLPVTSISSRFLLSLPKILLRDSFWSETHWFPLWVSPL